jgi:8-oxo-dGTP pyrophosphatase MutT (NUDIX family)
VIVLRDGPDGPENLMLKRSSRAGFFPHAWVFPGGRVDDADRSVPVIGQVAGLDPALNHFAVAAVRECFEEAGIWLGEGTPADGLRDRLNQHTATLLDAPDLVPHLDRLEQLAWWITPELEPKRYDTRFFLAILRAGDADNVSHDDIETVSNVWIRPEDALARHRARDDFFLAPPTFRTLEMLQGCAHADDARALARAQEVVPCQPVIELGGTIQIRLPGDPGNPSAQPTPGPSRIVLRDGVWRSENP